MLFVFLSLAALYESWKVPFTVIFGIPTGFFGASLAAMAFHVYNDIYFQIGLLTIIGLAAKNAILIVEYAKVRVDNGMDVMKASIEASQIRLRPILMTSWHSSSATFRWHFRLVQVRIPVLKWVLL